MSDKAAVVVAYFKEQQHQIILNMNMFTREHFICLGGREGSGMGGILEALYLFQANAILKAPAAPTQAGLAWITGHQYNDYACLDPTIPWDPETRGGELFRIEVKSMISAAKEAKAHFDQLLKEIPPLDQLLVIAWSWVQAEGEPDTWVVPTIRDIFIGDARRIAEYRDRLHLIRGGTFVAAENCPDGCQPDLCPHVGEPLNNSGKRERRSGPASTRVSESVPNAQNFGGLKRMLAARSASARADRAVALADNIVAREFVAFMERNFKVADA